MARIISDESWGFIILSLSYVTLFTLILTFLPPSLGLSFNYYIPRFRMLNQNNKLKSFIKYSLLIRSICVIPIYLVSIIVFTGFAELFQLNLDTYVHLLYILSPLIIINSFDKDFFDIVRSFNRFRIVLILVIIRYSVHIGGLLFLFFNRTLVSLELISLIIVLSFLIPLIFNFLIIIKIQFTLEKSDDEKLTLKEVLKNLMKYGSALSIRTYLTKFNREIKIPLIDFFAPTGTVVGFNIARHYSDVSYEAIGSFNRPLTISFSSLQAKQNFQQIEKIYRILFNYTLFLILLITGILFFITDIYIVLIYTPSRLEFSLIVKLLIIASIFNVQASFFYSLLRSSEKVRYLVPITVLNTLIGISIFIISLIFFGIIGAMIGINIGNIIHFIIISYLNFKLFKFRLNYKKTILLFSSFFIALLITLILETLLLANINYVIFESLNLLYFKEFQILSLITFLSIFLILLISFKSFTHADIDYLKVVFNRDNFIDKSIKKGLNLLKRLMRK
jgi:O-antigen/teichoic acid export membrane protein